MNANKKAVLKSESKKSKSHKRKTKKYRLVRFDKKRFYLILGIGFVSAAIGLWIIWVTKTAPEAAPQPMEYTTIQRVARFFSETTLEMLAFIMGNLFVLFGVICIFICLKLVVQDIADKFQN